VCPARLWVRPERKFISGCPFLPQFSQFPADFRGFSSQDAGVATGMSLGRASCTGVGADSVSESSMNKGYKDLLSGVVDSALKREVRVALSGAGISYQVNLSKHKLTELQTRLQQLFKSLAADWKPTPRDAEAAWEIHVELRTRITTQRLHYLDGDEGAALDSLVKLFQIVRDVCRKHGSAAAVTTAVADLMLNHSLRQLTASWHVRKLQGKLNPEDLKRQFRVELTWVQEQLRVISAVLHILATGQDEKLTEQVEAELLRCGDGWEYDRLLGGLEGDDQIFEKEGEEIDARRRTLAAATGSGAAAGKAAGTAGLVGLAISGGGIRSATFALGVVQVLARNGILAQVDLLSTVSGGGYTGSLLSSYLNGYTKSELESQSEPQSEPIPPAPKKDHPPFDTAVAGESHAIRYIRNHSKYMQPADYFSWAKTVGMALYGIVCNLLILGTVVLLAAWITESVWGKSLRTLRATGELPSWSAYLNGPLWWALALTAVTLVTVFLLPGVQKLFLGRSREGVGKLLLLESVVLGLAIVTSALWVAILALPVAAACWLKLAGWLALTKDSPPALPWSAIATGIATFAGFLSARGNSLPQQRRKSPILAMLMTALLWMAGPLLLGVVYVEIVRLVIASDYKIATSLWGMTWQFWGLGLAFLLSLFFAFSCNVNLTSLHRFYRNRLAETFLLRHAAKAVEKKDRQLLSEMRTNDATAPYHLINAVVNLPGSQDPRLRGRACDYFLFSKHFCGGPITGYRPTDWCEQANPMLDLGTAVAISGAAAAPQMGVASVSGASFLLTMLNIRLGYWLKWPKEDGTVPFGSGPGPWYLGREATNMMHENLPYLNLSDGGHIENLAVMELLRRRCQFVVAIDGEQDGELSFPSLRMLQRYAKIELSTDIEIDCERLTWAPVVRSLALSVAGSDAGAAVEPEPRYSRAHFTLGRILYPECEGKRPEGWLVYVKLSVTGNEPDYVLDYRRQFPEFPHQSTLTDQVFDEAQFEAYRRLGEHACEDMFADELLAELQYCRGTQLEDLKRVLDGGTLEVQDWVWALRAAFRKY